MNTSRTIRILMLLAALPAWAYTTPAHAQHRRGGPSGGGGFNNFANQFMQGSNGGMPQRNYPSVAPPLGGSSLGGFQGQRQDPSFRLGGSSLGGLQTQQGGGYGSTPYINPSNLGGMGRVNSFNSGGLSNAFNQPQYQSQYQQPQYQQTPQVSGGPNPGQPYQIPAQYANYPAGSVINWGRYRYQLGSDGTMTLYTGPDLASRVTNTQQTSGGPTPGERYQIPAKYAGTAPGTQITYAGYSYVANDDGTMTASNAPSHEDANVEQTSTGPVPGKRYQIPAAHAGTAPGTQITYAGYSYVANNDGTMTAFNAPSEDDANAQQAGPVPGKRYQIPAEHTSTAPGSLITYGGNNYVANDDGTMTAFTSRQ